MGQKNSVKTLDQQTALAALQWHLDNDLIDMVLDEAEDYTKAPDLAETMQKIQSAPAAVPKTGNAPQSSLSQVVSETGNAQPEGFMGAAQAIIEARKIAIECDSLDALSNAIQDFDGLSLKKTASNIVFGDGNPAADIMVIGDAPAAEDDIQGRAFIGETGQLMDKILASIGLSRDHNDVNKAVYLTNVLNWRPPGNRTPTPQEIEISLPFIQRHIALVKPKIVIFLGGTPAKALLERSESISKLRGEFHPYITSEDLKNGDMPEIQSFVTYHPTYLLRTPAQKRAVWADMLMLKAKLGL